MSTLSQSSTLVNREESSPTDGAAGGSITAGNAPTLTNQTIQFTTTATSDTITTTLVGNDVGDGTSSMVQIYRILYISAFFLVLFILILIISYFAWGCARRQKDFSFEYLFESKSLRSQANSR